MLIIYKENPIRFDIISKGEISWSKTCRNFERASKTVIRDQLTKQALIFFLSEQWDEILSNSDKKSQEGEGAGEESSVDSNVQNNSNNVVEIDPAKDLDPYISDRDYAEFVVLTTKKTVKQEDSLVRQIFYTGISKDSANPMNLAIMAPSSEGKTHPVLETLNYFPLHEI